ncbi:TadG family pilus assembly protein [Desulfuromonas sp. TF]|uniref:pilus assembly protein TadG-related protein n=1 Tax=Desulfuromonas sp. TF TaxID=1232410 RepID=UPI0003FF462E|nr:TadG family pilus assembly protein [Desulfuromonas sp. TF]
MKSYGYLNNAKGAVAPLVAIMLVVIIVCVAVVVDLGHIHNVKIQLQRAVDAAALAGANQLDGSAGAVQAAKDEAEAVAAANQVDQESVAIVAGDLVDPSDPDSTHYVEVGRWDSEALGSLASDRFDPAGTPPNAVKVTATRSVSHVFFFFVPATDVIADAIAVAKPQVPILPLAVVTCVPAERMLENPGGLPDLNVCGITSYKFTNDQNDTAAWTSLTFGANANDIIDFMSTEDGAIKFNKIIFGKGLENVNQSKGIENEIVDSGATLPFNSGYLGCPDNTGSFPNGFNITCGLGQIEGEDLAAPSEYDINPPPLNPDANGIYGPVAGFDPLTDYGKYALPRWYNLHNDDPPTFESADHFTRLWSQDGILLPGSGESDPDYVARLGTYATCPDSDPSCKPYGDDRFRIIGNTENFIVEPSGQFAHNLNAALGFTPDYWPDFGKILKHAGYPKVGVINGNTVNVLSAFINNENVSDGTDLRCRDNEPFPEGEKTLRVNAPVIFAGACEDWQAVSNASNHDLRYIGLSKLLLTRVWTNQGAFDCGEDSEVVQLHGGETCSATDFDPTLRSGTYFSVDGVTVPASLLALEGLTLEPVADDEDDQGSLLKVFLVE